MESSGWAFGYSASDFELLCPNGERVPLTEWETCNLGVIPPNVVMTRPVITAKIQDFLMKSQVRNLTLVIHTSLKNWVEVNNLASNIERFNQNPTRYIDEV